MQKIKKYLPIIIAGLVIVLIIVLPLFFKTTKVKKPSQLPSASPAQVLGETVTSIPSPIVSPTPTPTKKSSAPKPASSQTPIVFTTSISSPTPTPTPTPTPIPAKTVIVDIQNLGTYTVEISENDTAYDVLVKASLQNNFTVTSEYYTGMGYFITGIGAVSSHDNFFWAFYYNRASSMVGASAQKVNDHDITAWKFESW